MILGLDTAVHAYSLTTSCLFRTLQLENGHRIVGYKLSPTNNSHLYIFTSNGTISKWEWTSGKQVACWDGDGKVLSVDAFFYEWENNTHLVSYTLRERNDGKREIAVRTLDDPEKPGTVVLESRMRISGLRIAQQGRVVVAYGGSRILVGTTNAFRPDTLGSIQYTWREAPLPDITCLDIRESESPVHPRTQPSKEGKRAEGIDLVLGVTDGPILIYHDFLRFFPNDTKGREGWKALSPRKLHWHRGPVNTVRWSKDGNYILSGGNEPVMVLWQLDTGKNQFLPHLPSAISSIAVSPTGNLYVLKLANNSTMVLSARELKPCATITGLQLCPKISSSGDSSQSLHTTAAVLHPQYPDQLLIAVPTFCGTSEGHQNSANTSVIQAYDMRTNSHVSRQAVARTNATTVRVSPEGYEIRTPDIKYLDICEDGKWMATVDAWSKSPLDFSGKIRTDSHEEFLKFWRWNSNSTLWELVTRVDSPHFVDGSTVPVLGLACRPHTHEFVTIGVDATLRFWCPAIRQRSGLNKGQAAESQSTTWKCRNVIDLQGTAGSNSSVPLNAASLAFSEDGSALAVCLPSQSATKPSSVLLIDAQNATVHYNRAGIYSGDPCSAKFIGSHLVVTSARSVSVWDTVNDLVRVIGLPDMGTIFPPSAAQLLAVNSRSQTFAVATRCYLGNNLGSTKSHVWVYDVETLKLLSEHDLRDYPLVLLSDRRSGGYIIIDAGSNLRRLGELDKVSQSVRSRTSPISLHTGLADHLSSRVSGHKHKSLPQLAALDAEKLSHSQTPQLASVFDIPSFVLPPANALFRDVIQSLLAG
ncbi:hypothetical protein PHISCL_06793 [Aspergillus sclerotialis]|uniref:WD repeat-containing protein 75 second beta-propeller domain-containing protein n=1 Tax=Aspergillus sclerotialis TaxID=2070753 RepID=A0A3A2ZE43_9EURO|nr:hypothetical protein PHISCL_06793 [Aspergillus sclerotialis]